MKLIQLNEGGAGRVGNYNISPEEFKSLRLDWNISGDGMGKLLGLTLAAIHRMESGGTQIKSSIAMLLTILSSMSPSERKRWTGSLERPVKNRAGKAAKYPEGHE